MVEKALSLNDIRNMTSNRSKKDKKIRIEKLNLAASLKIKAHENLTKDNKRDELLNLKDQVKDQLKNNQIPLDAYTDILNSRVAKMAERVEKLEIKKADNGGFLIAGEENALADYTKRHKEYVEEKERVVKEFAENEQKDKEAQALAQKVKADKEQKALEAKEAMDKVVHEANVGAEILEDRMKKKLELDEQDRKAERINRGLDKE